MLQDSKPRRITRFGRFPVIRNTATGRLLSERTERGNSEKSTLSMCIDDSSFDGGHRRLASEDTGITRHSESVQSRKHLAQVALPTNSLRIKLDALIFTPRLVASHTAYACWTVNTCIIASNARLATARSGSVTAFVKASGVICQDRPHLSLHQPHALSYCSRRKQRLRPNSAGRPPGFPARVWVLRQPSTSGSGAPRGIRAGHRRCVRSAPAAWGCTRTLQRVAHWWR